jgi:hypothetical protein
LPAASLETDVGVDDAGDFAGGAGAWSRSSRVKWLFSMKLLITSSVTTTPPLILPLVVTCAFDQQRA